MTVTCRWKALAVLQPSSNSWRTTTVTAAIEALLLGRPICFLHAPSERIDNNGDAHRTKRGEACWLD